MKDTAWRILSVIEIALAALILIVTAAIGDCPTQIQMAAGGSVPMKCHWTFLACDLMAAIGIVDGMLLCLSKGEEARRKVAICCFATFVAVVLAVTVVMGVCTGDMSECKNTAAIIVVICIAGSIVALIQAAKPVKKDLPKQHL